MISCKPYVSRTEFSTFSNHPIEIKKVNNLRDLGGLKNSEGKIFKTRLIYRSGNLHQLKTSSFDEIESLNIKKIIDLRTRQEIAKEPDHLPSDVSYENLAAFQDENNEMATAKNLALKGKISAMDADQRMIKFYTDYVTENPEMIKKIITQILDSEHPIMYHCTAGKDRTGIITALILKVLKFDDGIIFQDYLLSNNQRKMMIQKRLNMAYDLHFLFPKLDLGVIEKSSWVERDYLQASFDEINKKYGSMENYIHQVLDISEEQRELYIQKFLQ